MDNNSTSLEEVQLYSNSEASIIPGSKILLNSVKDKQINEGRAVRAKLADERHKNEGSSGDEEEEEEEKEPRSSQYKQSNFPSSSLNSRKNFDDLYSPKGADEAIVSISNTYYKPQ